MLSLKIKDLKRFTSLLFAEDAFDRFLLHEAQFRTAFLLEADGGKIAEFYDDEEKETEMKTPLVSWGLFRPFALKLISGKKLPVSFRIVLLTDRRVTDGLVTRSGFTGCKVSSLSLNLSFRERELTLTTGVAYDGFSPDRSLEKLWDETVSKFLSDRDCSFE